MKSRGMLLAIASLLCATAHAAQARELEFTQMRRFETPQYTIVAASEAEAFSAATNAAEVEQVLAAKFGRKPRIPANPPTLLLLSGKQIDRYLAQSSADARRARTASSATCLLMPSGSGARRLQQAVYHQLTHLFLQTQFEDAFPYWYEEGVALVFENLHVDGSQAVIGGQRFDFRDRSTGETQDGNRTVEKQGQALTLPNWIALSRVFSCDDTCSEYADKDLRYRMRREQWAVVHRVLIGDPEFGGQVSKYLQLWRERVPVEQAVMQSFGSSLESIDRTMRAYAAREDFPVARLPFVKPAISLRENQLVQSGEVEGMLASLMFDATASPRLSDGYIDYPVRRGVSSRSGETSEKDSR